MSQAGHLTSAYDFDDIRSLHISRLFRANTSQLIEKRWTGIAETTAPLQPFAVWVLGEIVRFTETDQEALDALLPELSEITPPQPPEPTVPPPKAIEPRRPPPEPIPSPPEPSPPVGRPQPTEPDGVTAKAPHPGKKKPSKKTLVLSPSDAIREWVRRRREKIVQWTTGRLREDEIPSVRTSDIARIALEVERADPRFEEILWAVSELLRDEGALVPAVEDEITGFMTEWSLAGPHPEDPIRVVFRTPRVPSPRLFPDVWRVPFSRVGQAVTEVKPTERVTISVRFADYQSGSLIVPKAMRHCFPSGASKCKVLLLTESRDVFPAWFLPTNGLLSGLRRLFDEWLIDPGMRISLRHFGARSFEVRKLGIDELLARQEGRYLDPQRQELLARQRYVDIMITILKAHPAGLTLDELFILVDEERPAARSTITSLLSDWYCFVRGEGRPARWTLDESQIDQGSRSQHRLMRLQEPVIKRLRKLWRLATKQQAEVVSLAQNLERLESALAHALELRQDRQEDPNDDAGI